jgi:lysophospholipase L1-like esterase
MRNILLIGDSLTQYSFKENGWGQQMVKWYNGKACVFNKGYAGYNSNIIANIMPQITSNINNIILCTILLGTNDCYNDKNGLISVGEYKKNIIYIIDYIHKLNKSCLILLVTPPVSKINNNIFLYAQEIREICNEKNIELIDLHKDNAIVSSDLCDVVHFNANANNKLFSKVYNTINNKYPFLAPNKLY